MLYAVHLPCSILSKLCRRQFRRQEDGTYVARLRPVYIKIQPRKRTDFTISHTTTFPVNRNKVVFITRRVFPECVTVEYATFVACVEGGTTNSGGSCEIYNHKVVSTWRNGPVKNDQTGTQTEVFYFPAAAVLAANDTKTQP